MKKYWVLIVLLVCLAGCGTTSKERITMYQAGITKAQNVSAEADLYIGQLDEVVASSDAAIKAGLPADQANALLAKIEQAKAVKATVVAYKQAAMKEADKCKATIDQLVASGREDFGAELEAIGSIITGAGAAAPPPTGTILTLIGTLVAAVGAAIGRIFGVKAGLKKSEPYVTAAQEIIEGNESSLALLTPELAEKVKAAWQSKQITPTTRLMVKEITE